MKVPRPLWPLVTAVLIGLPVLYVASFGPACWIFSRYDPHNEALRRAYDPLVRAWLLCPHSIQFPFQRFVECGMPSGAEFIGQPDFMLFYFDDEPAR